jgi:hypothetical protein
MPERSSLGYAVSYGPTGKVITVSILARQDLVKVDGPGPVCRASDCIRAL